ncbi:MAG: AAA family ATPase [Spirochaetes bacterium]|nr:AAA family ATPase [Spirochaetota bacterium]
MGPLPRPFPRAALLTGERGVGKTALCRELAQNGSRFTGVISPALFNGEGRKVGFSALCLSSGEQWELGRSDAPLGGPIFGKHSFSVEGIARALNCLREALARRDAVVIVDEIGPLEMQRGAGFSPILPVLAGSGDLLLVTRPGLAARVAGLLPEHRSEVFLLTPDTRDEVASQILEFLGSALSS